MDAAQLRTFGTKYTAAWCSHEAVRVAALYGENGSLTIKGHFDEAEYQRQLRVGVTGTA